jgi:putative copper export protein
MDPVWKALILIGATLVVGGGTFVRWTAREAFAGVRGAELRRRVAWAVVLGALLVIAGSIANVLEIVLRITRGSFNGVLFGEYLATSRHGQIVALRIVLVVLTAVWAVGPKLRSATGHALFALSSAAFLATISLVSHSAAMGIVPLFGDYVHLVATVAWAGTLAYLAWLPIWRDPEARLAAVRRISVVGVASVALLFATGIYMSTVHLTAVGDVVTSTYGRVLTVKLGLVVVVLTLAAANRWLFVPLLARRGDSLPLQRAVRVESIVLAGVLLVTGVLTSTEPPHDMVGHGPDASAHEHALPLPPRTESPNHIALAAGTLILAAAEDDGLLVRLQAFGPAPLTLEAVSPTGSFAVLLTADGDAVEEWRLVPGIDHRVTLPADDAGVWRLFGELGGEAFGLPVTIGRASSGAGLEATLVLVPTPTLSGGGESQGYVRLTAHGEPVTSAVSMSMEMPGMEHAGSLRELAPSPSRERPDAAPVTRLSFPMVGEWHVTLDTGVDAVVVIVEMLEE